MTVDIEPELATHPALIIVGLILKIEGCVIVYRVDAVQLLASVIVIV